MPGLRRRDAAGEACFPPPLAGANRAPGRDCRDLQSGTGPEGGHAGFEHGPHEIDFPPCLRRVLVEMQRRAGHEHRIIALQPRVVRQCGPSVRRLHPMADSPRGENAQGVDVGFAGAAPHTFTKALPGVGRLTFRNEETQLVWQGELSGRSWYGRENETPQPILWFQPAVAA